MDFNTKHARFLFSRIRPYEKHLIEWELLFLRDVDDKLEDNETITEHQIERLYYINKRVRKRSGEKITLI